MKMNVTLRDIACTGEVKTFFEISDILYSYGK